MQDKFINSNYIVVIASRSWYWHWTVWRFAQEKEGVCPGVEEARLWLMIIQNSAQQSNQDFSSTHTNPHLTSGKPRATISGQAVSVSSYCLLLFKVEPPR